MFEAKWLCEWLLFLPRTSGFNKFYLSLTPWVMKESWDVFVLHMMLSGTIIIWELTGWGYPGWLIRISATMSGIAESQSPSHFSMLLSMWSLHLVSPAG